MTAPNFYTKAIFAQMHQLFPCFIAFGPVENGSLANVARSSTNHTDSIESTQKDDFYICQFFFTVLHREDRGKEKERDTNT